MLLHIAMEAATHLSHIEVFSSIPLHSNIQSRNVNGKIHLFKCVFYAMPKPHDRNGTPLPIHAHHAITADT